MAPTDPSTEQPRTAFRARRLTAGGAVSLRECDPISVVAGLNRDNNLAGLGAALLDVRHRLEHLVELECAVDDWAELSAVIEGTELAQLGAAGLHEEEPVAHAQGLGLLADLAAER